VRLLIADHGLIRVGIEAALRGDDTLSVCAGASDARRAILEAERTRPDVCLVGWDIPGGAIAAVRGIFAASPSSSIVVLGAPNEFDDLLACVRAGAVGYAPAGIGSDGLRRSIRAVLADEAVVPRSMVRALIDEVRAAKRQRRGRQS
jgi:DNA-binding NarL/FixJ family response regulator